MIDEAPGWFSRVFGGPWHVLVFPLGDDGRYTEYNGVDLVSWHQDDVEYVDITALTAIEAAETEAKIAQGISTGFAHEILDTFRVQPAPPDFQAGEIAVQVFAVPPATGEAVLRISPAHEVEDKISGFDVTEGVMRDAP